MGVIGVSLLFDCVLKRPYYANSKGVIYGGKVYFLNDFREFSACFICL